MTNKGLKIFIAILFLGFSAISSAIGPISGGPAGSLSNSALGPTVESTTGATGIGVMVGPVTIYAKGIVIKQTGESIAGAAGDVATIPIPAGITRWRLIGIAGSGTSSIVGESVTSTLAAAQFTVFDQALGAGNAMSSTSNSGPVSTGQSQVIAGATQPQLASTAAIAVIRQTVVAVTSANRTCSFYLVIQPLNP